MHTLIAKALAMGFAGTMAIMGSTTMQTPDAGGLAAALYATPSVEQQVPSALDQWLENLAQCESKGNPKAINEDDGGSPSFGLFQYKAATWKSYIRKYDFIEDASDKDMMKLIFDRDLQIELTKHILAEKNGWKNWYNCIRSFYNRMDGEILSELR